MNPHQSLLLQQQRAIAPSLVKRIHKVADRREQEVKATLCSIFRFRLTTTSTGTSNVYHFNHALAVDLVDKRTFIGPRDACFMPPPDGSAGLLRW
jgi:hypothetical protein